MSPADLFASVPPEVTIVEVGPRDGLQNEATPVPVAAKVALIEALAEAGLPVVEAGSFVSPKWVPQMAGSDEVLRSVHRRSGVRYPVLVPNLKGLEAALAAGAEEIAVFGAASETFSQKNINCSIAESLERFRPVVQRSAGTERAGARLRLLRRGLPLRGRDRPGGGRPRGARAARHGLLRDLARRHDRGRHATQDRRHAGRGHARGTRGGALAIHAHDTYGQALANVLTALELGVRVVDSSVAGLGGCPYAKGASGNIATEDVVYMLDGMGVRTGVDLDAVIEAGRGMCSAWAAIR